MPNVQPGGPLLELLLCIKGRNEALIWGDLVSIQSRRNDVHPHLGAQERLRLPAQRPNGQPDPPGSGPLHSRGFPRPGAQLAADTTKRHAVPRGGDDNFVYVRLVDPTVLRHRGRWADNRGHIRMNEMRNSSGGQVDPACQEFDAKLGTKECVEGRSNMEQLTSPHRSKI